MTHEIFIAIIAFIAGYVVGQLTKFRLPKARWLKQYDKKK